MYLITRKPVTRNPKFIYYFKFAPVPVLLRTLVQCCSKKGLQR